MYLLSNEWHLSILTTYQIMYKIQYYFFLECEGKRLHISKNCIAHIFLIYLYRNTYHNDEKVTEI